MKKILVSIFLFLLFINTNATHLIGGTMSYKYIGTLNNKSIVIYHFTVKIYRDCESGVSANFDNQIYIGIYSNNKLYDIDTMPLKNIQTPAISDTCSCCPIIDYCYEEGVYEGTIYLDSGKEYAFINSRCCLSMSENTEYDQGFAIYSYMRNSSNASSSPYLARPLINYIWAQKSTQSINFKATDIDNDSLRYELTKPLLGGDITTPIPTIGLTIDSMFPPFYKYAPFRFKVGYTALSPFGNFAKLNLNAISGKAVFDSLKYSGSRFYWCIKISEYRNNVLTAITYTPISTHFNPPCTTLNVGFKEALISEPTISPNPFQNQIIINNLNPKINKIDVFDMSGKLQETIRVSAPNQTIVNFPHLPNGLYLLRFMDTDGNTVGIEKVVKSN